MKKNLVIVDYGLGNIVSAHQSFTKVVKDNNIDAVPVEDSPLQKLLEELPFDEKAKQVVKN